MKNLDYNQIIYLEIIGEEDKDNIYIYIKKFDKIYTIWWNYLAKPRRKKLNFYYILYDFYTWILIKY